METLFHYEYTGHRNEYHLQSLEIVRLFTYFR